jgi:hypothetical protein
MMNTVEVPEARKTPPLAGNSGTIFSFAIDADFRFTYDGWHLAHSLIEHCGGDPAAVHVQCTPEVDERQRDLFRELGCTLHEIARFGDGRYCNKLNQLESLSGVAFDRVVLLDTDTIAIADLRPFLRDDAILGKIVDVARPPLDALDEIAAAAGIVRDFIACNTDAGNETTYLGNCSGGFYSIPKAYCERLSAEWRRWTLWLLENIEPLRRIGSENHVDQVSFWLAISAAGLPFATAPSNVNYFIHIDGPHFYLDETRDIALLDHHNLLNVLGLLDIPPGCSPREVAAVACANGQIGKNFDNRLFWELRYELFPGRGSGIGSRGDNLVYKRTLLKEQGIEAATSVLDYGCGDIEVVRELSIGHYVGIDLSATALAIANRARPDWEYHLAPASSVQPAEMVLCFEVLIHQENEAAYRAVIAFLAEKTLGSLLVSGFAKNSVSVRHNSFVFFHEPLEASLRRTGRFKRIQQIGAHTSVSIYRCDV